MHFAASRIAVDSATDAPRCAALRSLYKYDRRLLPVTLDSRRLLRFKDMWRHILSEQVPCLLNESNT
jgi:hypothetical protein